MAMEIAPCDESLCGTLVWLQQDGELGGIVLTGLPLDANDKGVYKGGDFTDVSSGRTYYRVELRVQDDGKLRLQGMAGVMKDGRVVTSRFPTTFRFTRTELESLTSR